MPAYHWIRADLYRDSVALMRLGEELARCPGVTRATLLMGTPANKAMLAEAGLGDGGLGDGGLGHGGLGAARPDDLMVVIEAEGPAALAAARAEFDRLLDGEPRAAAGGPGIAAAPRSLAAAARRLPGASLALISVPGAYAAAEALKALRLGLDVFLFSDNVPLAAERRLKQLAERKGLLMMGPDCGTAILDGVPLGFANAVRRGPIGIVGASGTGIQEITCQIHRRGGGISQAIGTGGRDLDAEIGGAGTRAALALLARDSATEVVVLVAKPPAPAMAAATLAALGRLGKPAVVLLLDGQAHEGPSLHGAADLEAAAQSALALSGGGAAAPSGRGDEAALGAAEARRHAPGQRHLRGLYTGGTYALEAQLLWRRAGLVVHSNAPVETAFALEDPRRSRGHSAIDLGDDVFTIGRPHPIIDPAARAERLRAEARDPTVATLVLDVVIGAGAHPDPAAVIAPAIAAARAEAAAAGRHLTVIAWICGTEADTQGLARQEAALAEAGALLAPGSTAAARLAARTIGGAS